MIVNIVRYGLFATLVVFSLIVLGLSGHILSLFESPIDPPAYLGLDLATAVLTIVCVAVSLIVEIFRRGAFTSMVAVEIGWVSLLMVLWVASAGDTIAIGGTGSCNFVDVASDIVGDVFTSPDSAATGTCHEVRALEAFTWLNWLITLGWLVAVIVLSAITHSRGNSSVWVSPITSVAWGKSTNQTPAPPSQGYQSPNTYAAQPTMVQQHTGYSQGYPPQQNPYSGGAQV